MNALFLLRSYVRLCMTALMTCCTPAFASPPTFTSLFAPQVIQGGSSTSITAGVAGTAPLYFQWHQNGATLPGETNATLLLANALAPQGGWYHVVVSNTDGVATSSAISVTILGRSPEQAGLWPGFKRGYCYGLAVTNGIAHGLILNGAYFALSVSNPANPVFLGTTNLPSIACSGMRVESNRAFITAGSFGLQVLDVSNPAHPVIVASTNAGGTAVDEVFLSGSYALVPAYLKGLHVYNVSNPAAPFWVSTFTNSFRPRDVHVAGSLAYIADETLDLVVADVSDPTAPVLVGSLTNLPGSGTAVHVEDGKAYLANGSGGLFIVSVTNPAAPILLGSYPSPGFAQGLAVQDGLLYLAAGPSGLLILSVTNPAAPALLGSYATEDDAVRVSMDQGLLWISADAAGFYCLNPSNPASPVLIKHFPTWGLAHEAVSDGKHAFVADDSGVHLLDVTDPHSFVSKKFTYVTPTRAFGIARKDDYLYVPTLAGLRCYVISQQTNLAYVTNAAIAGGVPNRIRVRNDLALLGTGAPGIQLYSLTNPASPSAISVFNTDGQAYAADTSGSTAFVADWTNGLVILSITNPASPSLITNKPVGGNAVDVTVVGSLAYVAAETAGFFVMDVSNPSSPVIVGSNKIAGAKLTDVKVHGSYAFVADLNGWLRVINVSTPTNPVLFTSILSPDAANSVTVFGNTAIVCADDQGGIQAVDISHLASIISTQPPSAIVHQPSPYTLSVATTGAWTKSYQWFRDGVAVVGATNATLDIGSVTPADVGNYTVTVTDYFGLETSAAAPLTAFRMIPGAVPVSIGITAPAGLTSRIEFADSLLTNSWSTLTSVPASTGEVITADAQSTNLPNRSYRVAQP